jgi:hypothetical protein
VAWRLVLRRRQLRGLVLRHTLPQLALLRLQVLHDLPHLLARRQLIPRLIRLAQRPWQRSLLRLQLRRRQHVQ